MKFATNSYVFVALVLLQLSSFAVGVPVKSAGKRAGSRVQTKMPTVKVPIAKQPKAIKVSPVAVAPPSAMAAGPHQTTSSPKAETMALPVVAKPIVLGNGAGQAISPKALEPATHVVPEGQMPLPRGEESSLASGHFAAPPPSLGQHLDAFLQRQQLAQPGALSTFLNTAGSTAVGTVLGEAILKKFTGEDKKTSGNDESATKVEETKKSPETNEEPATDTPRKHALNSKQYQDQKNQGNFQENGEANLPKDLDEEEPEQNDIEADNGDGQYDQ